MVDQRGVEPTRAPVTDWATDFDHHDEFYAEHAPEVWAELRSRCPVAHTDRFHGAWLPVRYDDIAAVAYDTATFSSRSVVLNERRPDEISFVSPPITSDPPEHGPLRKVLLPRFTPKEIDRLEPVITEICDGLLDRLLASPRPDAALGFAQHLPVLVTARMLGLPESDADRFRTWVNQILVLGPVDIELGRRATYEVIDYFRDQIADRRRRGGDDLVSWVAGAEVDGEPVGEKEQLGILFLLLLAGIDTTWSTLGAGLHHLATDRDDQAWLREDLDRVPNAVEELLRYFAPVSVSRIVTADTTLAGVEMRAGERVALAFPAANRDPDRFPDADRVVLDREREPPRRLRARHPPLPRLEPRPPDAARRARRRFLARTPPFRLADGAAVAWTGGQVRGPRTVPLAFDR